MPKKRLDAALNREGGYREICIMGHFRGSFRYDYFQQLFFLVDCFGNLVKSAEIIKSLKNICFGSFPSCSVCKISSQGFGGTTTTYALMQSHYFYTIFGQESYSYQSFSPKNSQFSTLRTNCWCALSQIVSRRAIRFLKSK